MLCKEKLDPMNPGTLEPMTRQRARIKGLIIILLLAGSLFNCGSPFGTEEFGLVKRLRVAAIVCEPAEVKPGGVVHLIATVISPKTENFTMVWAEEQNYQPVPIGSGMETDWTAPVTEGIYPVFLYVEDDTGDRETAMKKVVVSNSDTPNHNPKIAIIAVPSPVIGVPVNGKVDLKIESMDPDPGDEENLRVAWMITKGKLTDDIIPEVTWTAPSEPGDYIIYGALRDMRGGVAISQFPMKVSAP
jgi:hypothetical protein